MTTVLVIDDSPSEMAKFRDVLVKNRFTMLEAMDGETGIQMAIDHVPDVILMDVVMPEMNGFQATRKITRNKTTAHIPVVIVSTKNQETDRVWGKRQGAKEYLTKPIREVELLKVITSVLPSASRSKSSDNASLTASQSTITRQPISATQQTQQQGYPQQRPAHVNSHEIPNTPNVGAANQSPQSTNLAQPQQQKQTTSDTDIPDNGIYL